VCGILAVSPCFCEDIKSWSGLSKQNDPKKYLLPTGFVFPVVTTGAIYSYLIESPCVCLVEYPVDYLGKEMIPKGTRIIGTAQLYPNTDRVLIKLYDLVFPNGEELRFTGMSLQDDPDGKYHLAIGVPGKKGKTSSKLPAKVLISTLNTAAATLGSSAGGTLSVGTGAASTAINELTKDAGTKIDYTPDYTVTVPKGVQVQVFNISRIEY